MRIAILGYGQEGKSAEQYFKPKKAEIEVFDHFTPSELNDFQLDKFDLIFRSPSLHPHAGCSSMTKYFFDHCPCQIIGVTGTKGKGTTCTILRDILQKLGQKVWLVGNIGKPALDVLDEISPNDIVIYEMSSFQLWDLEKSPHIAVILKIEPDHLDIHDSFEDYLQAKSNIARWQKPEDFYIYYQNNPNSTKIANTSPANKIAFPIKNNREKLDQLLDNLQVVGQHNREDAEAALTAAACYYDLNLQDFVEKYQQELAEALRDFHSLPHRLEFLRELNGVKYYDDNFSTTSPSTLVALEAFASQPIIHIVGGRDKTANLDLPEIAQNIQEKTQHAILIGESGHELAKLLPTEKITIAESLQDAVLKAQEAAEKLDKTRKPVVLMSPAAASFDMFKNVYDRGAQFQKLVQELK